MKHLKSTVPLIALVLVWILSACTPPATPAAKVKIRIAALPIIDALPFYLAQKEGLFAKNNVEVEFIAAASAAERDQLVSAAQADGMINDLVSVAFYNRDQVQVQVVRFARVAASDTAMYRILAAKDSGIHNAAGLAGVPVGMSQGTVIDYITSRLLEKEGLPADQITSIAVPKLNERMALLESGELKAATLPEPFGTMAIQKGAVLIVDDSKYPQYGSSVISFRKAFIDQNPQAIRGFLAAVEEAASAINKDGEKYRTLLGEYKLVPEPVISSYPMPTFPAASIPTQAQFEDAVAWAKGRSMITTDVKFADSVTSQFLPEGESQK